MAIDVPTEPLPILGDGARLTQIISNLLNNAARFTAEGGHIALAVRREGARVLLSVKDDGIGIPPDMRERVFDMFTQIESPGQRKQEGLGIGLALVKRLVAMHDGGIEARSEGPGCGSELVVRLPLAPTGRRSPDGAGRNRATPRPDRARSGSWSSTTTSTRPRACRACCGMQAHEVRVAYDGLAALAAARDMNPDVVLLDIGLPKLDGLEVAKSPARARRRAAPPAGGHHRLRPGRGPRAHRRGRLRPPPDQACRPEAAEQAAAGCPGAARVGASLTRQIARKGSIPLGRSVTMGHAPFSFTALCAHHIASSGGARRLRDLRLGSGGSAGTGSAGNGQGGTGTGGTSTGGTGGASTGGANGTGGSSATGGLGGAAPPVSAFIVVDQFGYLPDGEKIALVRGPQTGFDAGRRVHTGLRLRAGERRLRRSGLHRGARRLERGATDAHPATRRGGSPSPR